MNDKQKILDTFESYRWFLMLEAADAAEEQGDLTTAEGWRWMEKNHRYPIITSSHHCWMQWNFFACNKKSSHTLPIAIFKYWILEIHLSVVIEDIGTFLKHSAKIIGKALRDKKIKEVLPQAQQSRKSLERQKPRKEHQ